MAVLAAEGLHRGLVLKEGYHDLAAVGILLAVHHHQIVGQDARVEHGLTPDPQGKVLPGLSAGVEGEVVLNTLLGQDGGPGRHAAHHGHPARPAVQLLGHGTGHGAAHGDGPCLALRLGDEALLLQPLQMEVDGGGGFQPHRLANLADRGGVAVVRLEGDDIVVDLLLFG